MSIQCKEIVALSSLEELKLVAGREGLDRTLRWVYVADSFDDTIEIIHWIHGGELVLMSGIGLKGDVDKFARLIQEIDSKGVAGVIVSIGPYISAIPDKIKQLADYLRLPIFELPWEIKFVDVTREVSTMILMQEIKQQTLNNLLENILYSRFESEEELINVAKQFHFNLLGSGLIGIVDVDDFSGYIKTKKISSEREILRIKDKLRSALLTACQVQQLEVLTMQRSDAVIFLVQMQNYDAEPIRRLVKETQKYIHKNLPDINISFGIGRFYTQLKELHLSLKEAEQALRVAQCEKPAGLCFFDDLGIYSILLNISDRTILENYYHNCFDPLIEYDHINKASLLNTLETYLQENCNQARTAEKMFLHRNTLKYRLQKIEHLLGCDLKNLNNCSYYDIGFKIRNLLL